MTTGSGATSGGRRGDGDLQPRGGRDGAGGPYHITATWRQRRCSRTTSSPTRADFTINRPATWTTNREQQDLRRCDPSVDHGSGLPGGRRRDGDYSRQRARPCWAVRITSRRRSVRRRCSRTTSSPTRGELHDQRAARDVDDEREQQDLRRRRSEPVDHGKRDFLAADGVTATYSRAAGETVLGGPYHITATLGPAAVLSNYAITNTGANSRSTRGRRRGRRTPTARPTAMPIRSVDHGQRRLPGGGRRDGDLQPHGGRDGAGRSVSHHGDAESGGGALELHHHQHGANSRSTHVRRRGRRMPAARPMAMRSGSH